MTTNPGQQDLQELTDAIRDRLRGEGFDGKELERRVKETLIGHSVIAAGNGLAEILASGSLDVP